MVVGNTNAHLIGHHDTTEHRGPRILRSPWILRGPWIFLGPWTLLDNTAFHEILRHPAGPYGILWDAFVKAFTSTAMSVVPTRSGMR